MKQKPLHKWSGFFMFNPYFQYIKSPLFMRYCWLPFALLFVLSTPLAAQHLDSLNLSYQKALRNNDQVKQGIYLSDIARYYYRLPNSDSSFHYYTLALRVNKLVENDTMIASNLNDLGNFFKTTGNLDSAQSYYTQASILFQKLGNALGGAYTQINLAIICKDQGLYERALEQALASESVLSKYPDDEFLDNCYSTIGLIYSRSGDYNNALSYYGKALVIRQSRKEFGEEASTLNNIGNVFMNIGKYDSALTYFLRSLEIKKKLANKKSTASTLNNLGEVLVKMNRFKEAENYYGESLSIKREANDKLGQLTTLNNLAYCKIQLKEYNLAKQYLDEAENLERSIGGVLSERKNNLQFQVALNRAIKNYAKASDYAEQLLIVKDSLLSTEKAEAMAEIQARYETEKKEQQIEILNTEQALNQTAIKAKNFWIAALIIAIALTVVIAILVYNSFILAKKARERVETLMKELHHRVKNNLQVLSSVLSLQSQHLTDENALLSVKSTEGRINAMALIHRKLYSDETSTIVSTRGYFRELVEFLMSSYGFDSSKLKLKLDIDEVELDVDKAIPLGLIVNELISNAFKHAYVNQDSAELSIALKKRRNELYIVIGDNGRGLPQGFNTDEEGFGSRMVAILVKDLKGVYQVDNQNGTVHTLTIPMQNGKD